MEVLKDEMYLLQLLKAGLQDDIHFSDLKNLKDVNWETIIALAEKHSVLSLLYEQLNKHDSIPSHFVQMNSANAKRTVLQQYRLLFLSKYLINALQDAGVQVVLLKGVAAASYYPTPELRKSGDVDLLLMNPCQENRMKEIMLEHDFWVKEEQLALHHITFETKSGIEIEVHTLLAEPFDNQQINQYMDNLLKKGKCEIMERNIMGVNIPVLAPAYFAYELLLHMLQHFLRSGFGLKLLCDWVVFWREEKTQLEKEKYLQLVKDSGLKQFSDMVTLTCKEYLGLEEEKIGWMNCATDLLVMDFIKEILEAEEFGKSHVNRMVVMRGTKLWDYVREFHHQMHLGFPNAGKCIILWPILWIITLARFLVNNHRLRKVSTIEILKEAKRRSKITEQLKLFQK